LSDNEENGSVFSKHFSSQFTKTTDSKPKGDATREMEWVFTLFKNKKKQYSRILPEFYKQLYLIIYF